MQIKLGEKIRELRQRVGITQESLANALGVSSQAVSRWESNGGYPDMEIVPSIANFFGISIDELFGYENERAKKVDDLVKRINEMNEENNGVDVSIDECIRLARDGMTEFPGNEKIMAALASVLFNAGYVRYGEHHLTDAEGYDIYDVERHKNYAEWQEAIKLYEKLLATLAEGEIRYKAVKELGQLYLNLGMYDKAEALAGTAPSYNGCRELLLFNSCDGKKRAEVLGKTLLEWAKTTSELLISGVMTNKANLTAEESVEIIKNAAAIYDLVCTDGNYGFYSGTMYRLYLYMSEHLWRAGKHDEAFEALDKSLELAKKWESFNGDTEAMFNSPLLRHVKINPNGYVIQAVKLLPEDWPWWAVPDCTQVKAEMQTDPRWDEWVKNTQS